MRPSRAKADQVEEAFVRCGHELRSSEDDRSAAEAVAGAIERAAGNLDRAAAALARIEAKLGSLAA